MLKWEEVEKRKQCVTCTWTQTVVGGFGAMGIDILYEMRSQEATIWVSQAQGLMLSARLPSARLSCQGERVRGLRQGARVKFRLWALIRALYLGDKSDEHPFEAMRFTSVPGFFNPIWPPKMWCFLLFGHSKLGFEATNMGMPQRWGRMVGWPVHWWIPEK